MSIFYYCHKSSHFHFIITISLCRSTHFSLYFPLFVCVCLLLMIKKIWHLFYLIFVPTHSTHLRLYSSLTLRSQSFPGIIVVHVFLFKAIISWWGMYFSLNKFISIKCCFLLWSYFTTRWIFFLFFFYQSLKEVAIIVHVIYLSIYLLTYSFIFVGNSLILVRIVSDLEPILETHHEPGVYLDRMTLPSQGTMHACTHTYTHTFTSGGNLA